MQYNSIHRLETNKLRNVAKFFGHLLHTDLFLWSVFGCVHLNEDETTSSSRIFIKILVQEMAKAMGIVALKRRVNTDNPDGDDATLLPFELIGHNPSPDDGRRKKHSSRDKRGGNSGGRRRGEATPVSRNRGSKNDASSKASSRSVSKSPRKLNGRDHSCQSYSHWRLRSSLQQIRFIRLMGPLCIADIHGFNYYST
jgi:pre-mRNA-splicing factor CWC22